MNYIKLVNKFWEIRRERDDFDPYVIALYFSLVNAANSNNWNEFSVYREDIIAMAGMSPSAYYKARKILQSAGLIGFKEGANKLSKCVFTVFPLYATNTVDDTLQRQKPIHSKDTTNTVTSTILNKPINIKTDKPINFQTGEGSAPPGMNNQGESTTAPKNKKKKSPPGSAPPPKKKPKPDLLFSDSEVADREVFKAALAGTDYEYADLNYYHEVIKNWAESKGEKKKDWVAAAKNWMLKDSKENKLKLKNGAQFTGKSAGSESAAEFGSAVDQYVARRYGT